MAKWLIKSEPGSYGWDDLVREGSTWWDGVRNNAARLHLRAMAPGDEAFFYHSGAGKAVVGIVRIAGPAAPDGADGADGASTAPGTGAWVKVPVAPLRPLPRPVTLAEIKADPRLSAIALVRQPRLSVSPVSEAEWAAILELAR